MATVVAPERKPAAETFEDERAWTRGSVWTVEFIRVKPGRGAEYLRTLGEKWRKVLEDQKKAGIVLSYRILSTVPSSRDDFTHMLMIEYPNYGAFDRQDQMEASAKKVMGSLAEVQDFFRKREEIREVIGGKLLQEIHLK